MKVQCLIRRSAGSTVNLGDQTYRFEDTNEHCCDVEDAGHLEVFSKNPSFRLEKPLEPPPKVVLKRKR